MMIEADVSMGRLSSETNATAELQPVMAHNYPADQGVTIDLTLEKFVEMVLEKNKTGLKLDFKSTDALKKGVEKLMQIKKLTEPKVRHPINKFYRKLRLSKVNHQITIESFLSKHIN